MDSRVALFFHKQILQFLYNIGKTLDGPPSSPPTDIRVGVINNTAAFVRWSPPPIAMLNGELTGYKVNYNCTSISFTYAS